MTATPSLETTLAHQRGNGNPEQQRAAGKALRANHPRERLSEVVTRSDRDPVALLRSQDPARVEHLVPVRWDRMLVSPFTFYRGTALLMADDLAAGPSTDLVAQCCGDAHLGNFGIYNSPERIQVFDINDFDETAVAPFEWDVKRLAASVALAARHIGCDAPQTEAMVRATVATYRTSIAEFAELSALELWHRHLDVSRIVALAQSEGSKTTQKGVERLAAKAEQRTHLRSFDKLTTVVNGRRQFLDDPPLLERVTDNFSTELIADVLDRYAHTLLPERRLLFDRYRFVDAAIKVVGVGSVGTRCYVGLFEGEHEHDWLILQMKQAMPSVLARAGTTIRYANEGERVVVGQRVMQAVSDIFLGWTRNPELDHDFLVRQLHDGKGAVDLDSISTEGLRLYAPLCAQLLARGHARSGCAARIAGYIGKGERIDEVLTAFSLAYADLTEADYDTAIAARKAGRIPSAQ
ncbi:MAG: DUF2252 domain-containing protein [Acidimicrobiia bacterium]